MIRSIWLVVYMCIFIRSHIKSHERLFVKCSLIQRQSFSPKFPGIGYGSLIRLVMVSHMHSLSVQS